MRINLTGGDNQSRVVIQSAQRRLNVYPEGVDKEQGEFDSFAHIPTPGLVPLAVCPTNTIIRSLYTASNGDLYCASSSLIYYLNSSYTFNVVGTIGAATTPVSFADNGTNMIIADGSANGWSFNILTRTSFVPIVQAGQSLVGVTSGISGWPGATRVDYTDTFFVANDPGTYLFNCSGSESVLWDSLDFAGKVGKPDILQTLIVAHRVIWLLGTKTTEIWYNSGGGGSGALANNSFPFQIISGVMQDCGIHAVYSLAMGDNNIFWLAQDQSGKVEVMMGSGYNTKRISNHALEYQLATYSTLTDAIGFCYKQEGHLFYFLTFPTADVTWCWDMQSGLWHQRSYNDGISDHRHRANCHAFAYGYNIVGDWQNGTIYRFDLNNYNDSGQAIHRLVTLPHIADDQDYTRVVHSRFIADMQTDTLLNTTTSPSIQLSWSDDRGRTFNTPVNQPIPLSNSTGNASIYNSVVQWTRLGHSRDRVYKLEWYSQGYKTALSGAWLQLAKEDSAFKEEPKRGR